MDSARVLHGVFVQLYGATHRVYWEKGAFLYSGLIPKVLHPASSHHSNPYLLAQR